jgi:glycosyltransferase involved in cell wall biosynthesis
LKIALVHDWLTGFRGGERVLDHLAGRFPDADLFSLFHTPGAVPPRVESLRIHTSPLNRLPGAARHYRKLLPLFPWAIQRFDFEGYDLVISTSHAVAKSIRVPAATPHLDYCFTPMRYIWDQADAYLGQGHRRRLASPLIRRLQRFDVETSGPESVSRFVAISNEVATRIGRHYKRTAAVVAPPVDISWIETSTKPREDFYLLVAGFVPYKKDELAVRSLSRLGRRLIVVGDGPLRGAIERLALPHVEFRGRVSDAALADLYRQARALIYPQHEDFGLVAVEAQAAGCPVIAYGRGGALDTIRPLAPALLEEQPAALLEEQPAAQAGGKTQSRAPTGLFFEEQTEAALAEAIERFEKSESIFNPQLLRQWAECFSPERFDREFDAEIEAVMRGVA